MNLTLKNIKHTAFASHETHCYEAALYVDGKPIALACNDGQGGCDFYHPHPKSALKSCSEVNAEISRINKWFETQVPVDTYHDGNPMFNTVEIACCNMVNEFLRTRKLRSFLKNKIVLSKDGKIYTVNAKFQTGSQYVTKAKADGYSVLNELPFEDALAVFEKCA